DAYVGERGDDDSRRLPVDEVSPGKGEIRIRGEVVRSDDVISDDVAVEVLAGRVAVNRDASEAVAPDVVALHEVVVDGAACTVGAARYRRREDHSGPLPEEPL